MKELHKGWRMLSVGDVCEKASSNVSQNQPDNENGIYPIFGASGFIKNVSFYHQEKPYLTIVKDGSGVGRITKMDAFTSVIGTLQYILPKEGIDLDYLYYNLISIDFKKYVAGAAIPHIYFKDYKSEPFLWMPLPEQKRIVALLDECLAAIDKAKANAEQNLKNIKELFESLLNSFFQEIEGKYENVTLGGLSERVSVGHVGETSKFYCDSSCGVPFLRSQNVRSGYLNFEGLQYITKDFHDSLKKSQLRKGDILFVRVGANRGDCCVIMENITNLNCANIVFARLKEGNANYISRYCQSILGRKQLLDMTVGSAQGVINTKSVAELQIPFPPYNVQEAIIKNIEEIQISTDKLVKTYKKKLETLEELKKTILQKAFAGELVTKKVAAI